MDIYQACNVSVYRDENATDFMNRYNHVKLTLAQVVADIMDHHDHAVSYQTDESLHYHGFDDYTLDDLFENIPEVYVTLLWTRDKHDELKIEVDLATEEDATVDIGELTSFTETGITPTDTITTSCLLMTLTFDIPSFSISEFLGKHYLVKLAIEAFEENLITFEYLQDLIRYLILSYSASKQQKAKLMRYFLALNSDAISLVHHILVISIILFCVAESEAGMVDNDPVCAMICDPESYLDYVTIIEQLLIEIEYN